MTATLNPPQLLLHAGDMLELLLACCRCCNAVFALHCGPHQGAQNMRGLVHPRAIKSRVMCSSGGPQIGWQPRLPNRMQVGRCGRSLQELQLRTGRQLPQPWLLGDVIPRQEILGSLDYSKVSNSSSILGNAQSFIMHPPTMAAVWAALMLLFTVGAAVGATGTQSGGASFDCRAFLNGIARRNAPHSINLKRMM